MTTEQLAIDSALSSWKLVTGRADRTFSKLSEEQLFKEIVRGRNRPIYIWGHITAVHDALLTILGLGERLHPELDAIFVTASDKTVDMVPSGAVLKGYWDEINTRLYVEFNRLSAEDWLKRHMSMSDEDYAKDPLRNRLSVLLSRTNHTSFHLGQVILATN
ncbi:DinB family protein [Granulicella arctica]|uniref:DinB family protein n=1 Tax=Granulicella arctica TaxID=940613 RepID=UPI0021E03CA9|nr:DinB family protein [Granulicella arctica]